MDEVWPVGAGKVKELRGIVFMVHTEGRGHQALGPPYSEYVETQRCRGKALRVQELVNHIYSPGGRGLYLERQPEIKTPLVTGFVTLSHLSS